MVELENVVELKLDWRESALDTPLKCSFQASYKLHLSNPQCGRVGGH